MVFDVNTELRKLRPAEFYNLGLILNPSDNWKKLMASVAKEGTESVPKFSGEFITIVEQTARQGHKPAAAIFLEEWGTMGRKRPTLGLLLDILRKAELFRAADYLAAEVLKVAPPQRPTSGPAAPVDIESIAELLLQQNLHKDTTTTASNNANFCLRTTSEIPLSQEHFPMCAFDGATSTNDNNLAVDDNDVGVFEMQYAESRVNQVLDHAGSLKNPKSSVEFENTMDNLKKQNKPEYSREVEVTDLMKFSSASTTSNHNGNDQGYSRSDLIKFDSAKANSNENVELCEAIFPDLNVLRGNVSVKDCRDSSINNNGHENPENFENREMSSAELPACLGSFAAAEKPSAPVEGHVFENNSYFHRELMSAELPLCINDRRGFNSSESNLNDSRKIESAEESSQDNSAIVSGESLDSKSSVSDVVFVDNETVKRESPETELPCFVVEASTHRGGKSVGHDGGNNVLNSQELPLTVLELHQR